MLFLFQIRFLRLLLLTFLLGLAFLFIGPFFIYLLFLLFLSLGLTLRFELLLLLLLFELLDIDHFGLHRLRQLPRLEVLRFVGECQVQHHQCNNGEMHQRRQHQRTRVFE